MPLAVLAWWAFIFALVSGVVLSLNYHPWGDVFTSVSRLTGSLPYGTFVRRLHYLSGQCFLLFTCAHTLEHFLRKTYVHIQPRIWIRLALLFCLGFALVFTGFILKGDKEGILAGKVMYSLAREIPLCGAGLARILLRPGDDFFLLPYLHHIVTLPLIVIFLLGGHRRDLLPKGGPAWPLLAVLAVLSTFYPLPADIPPHVDTTNISGPWFFHGIQLLLRYIPPLWAGVIWPLVPIGLLAVLPAMPTSLLPVIRRLIVIFGLLHITMIIVAWCWTP